MVTVIESISLKNFQCHRHLKIKLSPRLTCLVGRTRAGKSAVLRGLKWLVFNRPSGKGFISHGTHGCTFQAVVDGKKIIRRKGDDNTYTLDGKELAAVGQGVPQEVADFLNLDERNFQGQHDAPFWLSLSPGEVSRELNQVVNLELMDRCLSRAASEVRSAGERVTSLEEKLADVEQSLVNLQWLPEFAEKVAVLKQRENDLQVVKQRRDAVQAIRTKIRDYLPLANLIVPTAAVDAAIGKLEALEGERQQYARLEVLLGNIKRLQQEVAECDREIKRLEKQYRLTTGDECPLCRRPNG